MSRVKAQHKCLFLKQVNMSSKGELNNDRVKERESFGESGYVKQE